MFFFVELFKKKGFSLRKFMNSPLPGCGLCLCVTTPLFVVQDVTWLAKRLANLQGFYRVNMTAFNHLDFLWATNVDQLLYNSLIELLPFSYWKLIDTP